MTKQEFISWAKDRNWIEDKYGHLQKDIGNIPYRFKLSSVSVRYEKQITFSDGRHEWLRIYSAYYSKLSITSKNQLAGLRR